MTTLIEQGMEMDRWNVPVTEFRPGRSGSSVLIVSDEGRPSVASAVQNALNAGNQAFDIQDLVTLSHPVEIVMDDRGPMC